MRRNPRIVDEIIVTGDAFPPEEGVYTVSYDTSLLDGDLKVIKYDSEKGIYCCIPNDILRCRFLMTNKQHQAQLFALANTARDYIHQDTTARLQNPYGNIAASAQVLPMSVFLLKLFQPLLPGRG